MAGTSEQLSFSSELSSLIFMPSLKISQTSPKAKSTASACVRANLCELGFLGCTGSHSA